ncbi:hypothetical protein ANN_21228 [Periplaneta americana]|uniref:Putative ionotropic receptor ligand binding domain-containing protein n=1 Tax=Periplaneta americana TaxID=6978 RepID=A0ABQ8SFL0_PERAM|nr:hypothetical protein ANN_21228 [Periplaneta americana]
MAGLCEGGNEPPGSLKATSEEHRTSSQQERNLKKYKDIDFGTNLLELLHQTRRWLIVVSRSTAGKVKCDPLDWDKTNSDKHGSYLLVMGAGQVTEQMERLQCLAAWNPRAQFVVVVTSDTDTNLRNVAKYVFNELWGYKVVNVVLLFKSIKERDSDKFPVDIYTWFPYTKPSGNCGHINDVIVLDSCESSTRERLRSNVNLFPEKIPNNMKGCPLRIATGHVPPFVIFKGFKEYSLNFSTVDGLDIRMLQEIITVLNLSIALRQKLDPHPWGFRLGNGTWIGLCGDLAYNRTDMVVDKWVNNLIDHLMFEDSHCYYVDKLTWFVQKSSLYPRWLSLFRIFEPAAWLCCFIAIPIAAALMRFFARGMHKIFGGSSESYENFVNSFCDSWATIMGISLARLPRNQPLRLFFLSWLMYSISMNTVIQAFLTSFLTDPGRKYQIDDIPALKVSKYVFSYEQFFEQFFDEELLKTLQPKHYCMNPIDCLTYIIDKGNASTLTTRASFSYALVNDFKNQTTSIHPFSKDMFQFPLVMLFQKGSPILESFNKIISRLVEGGFPQKFMNDVTKTRFEIHETVTLEDLVDDYIPLAMLHFQAPFALLLFGYVLGSVTQRISDVADQPPASVQHCDVLNLRPYFPHSDAFWAAGEHTGVP